MKAFLKTLVGDAWNISVVGVVVLAAVVLIYSGHTTAAGFVAPPLTLAGVGWLAGR